MGLLFENILCFKAYIHDSVIEVWTSCILQHTPLLITDGLYQQLNYSLHLVTSSAFIGTVEDLERSVTLQQILFIY